MTYEEFIDLEVLKVEKEKPLPKYPIYIEALKVFLIFMGVAGVVSYAAYYCGGYDAVLYTLPLYLQPWIATYVRRRWKKVALDALLLVLYAVWLLRSSALVVTLFSGAYMIGVTAYQIVREFSESEEREAGILVAFINVVLMLAIGIFAIVQGLRGFEWWLGGMAILFVVLFVRYQHYVAIEGAMKHLKAAAQHSYFSMRRVKQINNRIIWSFIGILLSVIGLAYVVGLDDVVENMAEEVVEYINFESHKGFSLGAPGTSTVMSDLAEDEPPKWDGSRAESDFTCALGDISAVIFIVWSVLTIGVLIAHLIIEERMRRKDEKKTEDLELKETKAFIRSSAPKRRRRSLAQILDRSPENLIRRAYYKRVKGEMGKAVQRSDTPKQVGGKLTDMETLVEQYSEVRYKWKSF